MFNKIKFLVLAIAMLFFASGCAVTDFDRSADFNSYKSFSWGEADLRVKNPVYSGALIDKNIKRTIENEFTKRGIRHAKTNSDVVVSYKTYTEEKQQLYGSPYGYGRLPFFSYRFYSYGLGWGYPMYWNNADRVKTVTQGTLIIDITDRKTNELVWRGSVEGNVDDVKNLQKQIQKGIKAILKKYPVTTDDPLRLPDPDITS
jgi:hypothetical protein